jgi:trehalose synthase
MDLDGIITRLGDFAWLIGEDSVERIRSKAKRLAGLRVVFVNSTYYGGGVSEILDPLTSLMNDVGVETEWDLIKGEADFFGVTKKMHNALQGAEMHKTDRKARVYETIIRKNALRMHLNRFDCVVIHDPQPLFLINHFDKRCPWIWHCHLDLSSPNREAWEYIAPVVEKYDAVIVTAEKYKQDITTPQLVFMPAINPFSIKNKEMDAEEVEERLHHYSIPTDLPLVVQVSRFDRWKDPQGVIEAFNRARQQVDATLVLLGNIATDDPEGPELYHSLLKQRDERIIVMSKDDTALVNALQRRATVVLQKSLREGFGLTVTEAMWKRSAVIGGNVGGICLQIRDGYNGFLVSTVKEAAERMVTLLKDGELRDRMGRHARESVKEQFLLSRLLEQYLDLLGAFEIQFRLRKIEY